MATKVFISYSRKDESFARQLATSMGLLGADVWIDLEDIPLGVKWSTAIQEALTASQVMLVILSPDSMTSNNVEDEWQYFLDQRKPVVPILYRPCSIHFQLNRLQRVNFDDRDYHAAFEELHKELLQHGFTFDKTPDQVPRQHPIIPPARLPARRGWLIAGAALLVVLLIFIVGLALLNPSVDPMQMETSVSALSSGTRAATPTPTETRPRGLQAANLPTRPPTVIASAAPTNTDSPPSVVPTEVVILAPTLPDPPTNTATLIPSDTPTDTAAPLPTATNTLIPSDTPTDTAAPLPTATNTLIPSNTPTNTAAPLPTATNTLIPSDTPTNTRTPRPSDTFTPTLTPSDTPRPTDTPTFAPTTEPNLILRYDETLFTLYNRSARAVDIRGLTFTQQTASGRALTFSASAWIETANGYSSVFSEGCALLAQAGQPLPMRPVYCQSRLAWRQVGDHQWFWISRDPNATFEMLRGREVLATCSVSAGECGVFLPD